MVKSGHWCANMFYLWVFGLLTYLAMPIAQIAAIFTSWDLGNEWVLDILKLTYAPDSGYETAMESSDVWILDPSTTHKSAAPDAWDPKRDLTPTELKTYKSAFAALDSGGKGCVTIAQFDNYIKSDPLLDTKAKRDALIKKVNFEASFDCIDFTEYAKWMSSSAS